MGGKQSRERHHHREQGGAQLVATKKTEPKTEASAAATTPAPATAKETGKLPTLTTVDIDYHIDVVHNLRYAWVICFILSLYNIIIIYTQPSQLLKFHQVKRLMLSSAQL